MNPTFQTILAVVIVATAAGFVAYQLYAAALGRRSKIGSCCAKGCEPAKAPVGPRTQFIPSDMLFKRR